MHRSLSRYALTLAIAFWGSANAMADEPDEVLTDASRAYRQGQYAAACQGFDTWLKSHGTDPVAAQTRFFYGEALAQLDRWKEARQQFAALLEHDPQHKYARQALFRRGEAAYLTGDLAAAQGDLSTFAERYPQDPLNGYALAYLAGIDFESGDFAKARQSFSTALERYQDGPLADECRLGLARCCQQLGQWDSARQGFRALAATGGPLADQALFDEGSLENTLGDYTAAASVLQRMLTQYPQSPLVPKAQLGQGYALYKLKRYGEAESTLAPLLGHAALKVDAHYWTGLSQRGRGDWPAAAKTFSAGAQLDANHKLLAAVACQAGDALLHEHQLGTAREAFARSLSAAPQGPWADDAQWGLVRVAAEEGQHAQVVELCEAFARQFPDSALRPDVELAAAAALVAQGRHEAAVKRLEAIAQGQLGKAKPSDGQLADARRVLTHCYTQLGRLDDAQQTLAKTDAPSTPDAANAAARYQVAEAAYAAGKWEQAGALFAPLAQLEGNAEIKRRALAGLAWSHFKQNQWAEAREPFERLLAEFPDSPAAPEASLALGRALEHLDKPAEALASYERAAGPKASANTQAEALWNSGRLHEQLGQTQGAIAAYRRLLNEHSDFAQLDAAIFRLAALLRSADQPQEADELLARLQRDFPQSVYLGDALLRRAEQALNAHLPEEAEQLLGQFDYEHAHDANWQHATYLAGRAAFDRSQWNVAEEAWERLCTKFPVCPQAAQAAYLRAEAAYRRGDFAAAAQRLAELEQRDDFANQSWAPAALLRRAQAFAQQKQWDEARETAQGLLARFPQYEQAYEAQYLIGRACMAQAEFDRARESYRQVLTMGKAQGTQTAALAQWMLGESYFHQENYEAALAEYAQLDERHPHAKLQAAGLLQSAKCQELLNRWPQAVECYERLLKDHPTNEAAAEATSRLSAAKAALAAKAAPRK